MDLRTLVEDIELYLKNHEHIFQGAELRIVQDLQKVVAEIKLALDPPPPPPDAGETV